MAVVGSVTVDIRSHHIDDFYMRNALLVQKWIIRNIADVKRRPESGNVFPCKIIQITGIHGGKPGTSLIALGNLNKIRRLFVMARKTEEIHTIGTHLYKRQLQKSSSCKIGDKSVLEHGKIKTFAIGNILRKRNGRRSAIA